jgi:acyl-CoA thioesterase
MKLEKLSNTTFRSTMGALSGGHASKNGEQRPRAFGGHVFAQSAYAASKTIDKGFIIHVWHPNCPKIWELNISRVSRDISHS